MSAEYKEPTMDEFMDAREVGSDIKGAYVLANFLENEGMMVDYNMVRTTTNLITDSIKINVNYDGERGAKTGVLSYNGTPFMIYSCAGRGNSDLEYYYVINKPYFNKAVAAITEW